MRVKSLVVVPLLVIFLTAVVLIIAIHGEEKRVKAGEIFCPKADSLNQVLSSDIQKILSSSLLAQEKIEKVKKISEKRSLQIRAAYCRCFLESPTSDVLPDLKKRIEERYKDLLNRIAPLEE